MDFNEYYVAVRVREILEEARGAARRRELAHARGSALAGAARAVFTRAHRLYRRWSSATSTGSKPTTARA